MFKKRKILSKKMMYLFDILIFKIPIIKEYLGIILSSNNYTIPLIINCMYYDH